MNKALLSGRLTRDPEVRYTTGEKPTAVARFTLAVDRRIKKQGEQEADFISCVAFGKTAEFIEKYFHKGNKMIVEGRITTGSYEKDGVKHYTTDITVENVEFAESKGSGSGQSTSQPAPSNVLPDDSGFMNISTELDDELPFA